MTHLFTTHQTGIWVHCDNWHKTSGVSMNIQTVSLFTSMWLLGRTSGTGLNIGRRAVVLSQGACHLEPIWSMHGSVLKRP